MRRIFGFLFLLAIALQTGCSSPTGVEPALPDGPIIDADPWTPVGEDVRG